MSFNSLHYSTSQGSVSRTVDPSYNFAISQVFSPSLLEGISNPIHESKIHNLLAETGLYSPESKWDLINGLEVAYSYLKEKYRCEYVYKNEIVNQILLKFHSDNSATLLKEVPSDGSIADIVIINSDTVAYEIKTELDSFERLSTQLESYESLYDFLYIVTHPNAVKNLKTLVGKNIGIIVFEKNGNLKIIRKARSFRKNFDPAKSVLTLRQKELVTAYEKYVSRLPKMGTALIYEFCYEWFMKLDNEDAHAVFNESLKSRKPSSSQFNLIKNCPRSLRMMFSGRELTSKYCVSICGKMGIFV